MNVKELKEFLKDIDDDVEVFYYIQKWSDLNGYFTISRNLNVGNIIVGHEVVVIGKQ